MLGATYIQRHPKTGGYWFRRRVPDHLRAVIGQREITRSLSTKYLSEAKLRSRPLANATDELFIQASGINSSGMNAGPSEPASSRSSVPIGDGRSAWVEEMIQKAVADGQGIVVTPNPTPDQSLALGDPQTGPEVPVTTTMPIIESSLDANATVVVDTAKVEPPSQPDSIVTMLPRQRVATVQEMFDRYLAEYDRRPRTERTWRTHLDMFLKISGLSWSSPVHTVSDAHVEDFILAMKRLPARRIDGMYRGMSYSEIIEKFGDRSDLPKLDQKTINNKVDSLRAIFYYAMRHRYISFNPFVGKTTKRGSRRLSSKRRLPFDLEDLNTLFSSALYKPPSSEWSSKAWLPIIACYSGCRLEEIGQLRVSDYRVRGGIPFFAITAVDLAGEGGAHGDSGVRDKTLKTDSSDREVPVHPILLRLGLPDLVNRMRQRGESRLFPDIISGSDEVTAAYSKWFGRHLNRLGITSPLKVFHSFRHGFKDACRNGGVPREIAEVLMGHAGRTVGDGYGSGYSLPVLAGEMSKVTFGLDWDKGSPES